MVKILQYPHPKLTTPCKQVRNAQEADIVARDVRKALIDLGDTALGLAANQINMPKAVAAFYLMNGKVQTLINPVIVDQYDPIIVKDSCLSFVDYFKKHKIKSQSINVAYYNEVTVQCSNGTFTFEGDEAIRAQHEINHLKGETILDHKPKPIRAEKKISRNQPCPCGSGIKYKKCCMNK